MAFHKVRIHTSCNEIHKYTNEYTKKFEHLPPVSIQIDPMTCVYKHWQTTRYEADFSRLANGTIHYPC